jgi:hypothetical protein
MSFMEEELIIGAGDYTHTVNGWKPIDGAILLSTDEGIIIRFGATEGKVEAVAKAPWSQILGHISDDTLWKELKARETKHLNRVIRGGP